MIHIVVGLLTSLTFLQLRNGLVELQYKCVRGPYLSLCSASCLLAGSLPSSSLLSLYVATCANAASLFDRCVQPAIGSRCCLRFLSFTDLSQLSLRSSQVCRIACHTRISSSECTVFIMGASRSPSALRVVAHFRTARMTFVRESSVRSSLYLDYEGR